MKIYYSEEVQNAFNEQRPILALESTIISHGMPYPQNLDFLKEAESLCRNHGVAPATIAIISGKIYIGIENKQIEIITREPSVKKISRREIGTALSKKRHGAVTDSATMQIAYNVGIKVFATGGIGGVHRDVENTLDISEDLTALGTIPMIVVSAGAKAILDIGRTLEYLETIGVPVLGYKTSEFPAFYSRRSGYIGIEKINSTNDIVDIYQKHTNFNLSSSILVANPIPKKDEIPVNDINKIIKSACSDARNNRVSGRQLTPYLLAKIVRKTNGKSLDANIALALNNVRIGAKISKKISKDIIELKNIY